MNKNEKGQVQVRDYEYINLSFLNTMADGNDTFILDMLQTFNTEAAQLIDHLREAMKNNDLDKIRFYTHKFKSSVSLVGNHHLQNLLNEVEMKIKQSANLDNLPAQMDEIFRISSGVLKDVSEELKMLR